MKSSMITEKVWNICRIKKITKAKEVTPYLLELSKLTLTIIATTTTTITIFKFGSLTSKNLRISYHSLRGNREDLKLI